MSRALGLTLAAVAFCALATANSGGYRYGVSDQAFYTPAVIAQLHPDFYPRDRALLSAESRLMLSDKLVAGLSRALGVDLPPLYLVLYLAGLAALFGGSVVFARRAGLSWWATAAFIVLLTLRHRIAKTGANSLEGYMHPRMIAFALGVWAFAAMLAGRYGWTILWTAAAACWHPTTAFWFGLAVGIALLADRPAWRRWLVPAAAAAGLAAVWAVWRGPLAGRLHPMDPAWLAVLAEKDYLFPHRWPLYAWLANLAYPVVIVLIYRRRRHRGVTAPGERALVAGLLGLAGAFAVVLPFTILRLALAVQMQVTRVFWLLDFATAAYLSWWLMDQVLAHAAGARRAALAILVAASAGRGVFLLAQNRALFAPTLPQSPWVQAMRWLKDQPPSWYVLADPGHAWKYGVSVRLAAEKDTLVEEGKDTALAMYDRGIALAVGERLEALRDFDRLDAPALRTLAARYGVDVAVVESARPLDLPVLYRNDQFVIYKLRP